MRCDHCGMDKAHAQAAISRTHCNPPFVFQRHSFTGKHPADEAEAIVSIKEAIGNALENGYDYTNAPADFLAGDLIECDADFEGWEIEALTPLVKKAQEG